MTESRNYKTDAAVIARLASGKEPVVLEAISGLREKGNPLYLPRLLGLLLEYPSGEIYDTILTLLGELKFREGARYLTEAIAMDKYAPLQQALVACCWQNNLDYRPWFSLFVSLVIQAPFETAFEAFTVIENMDPLPETAIRESAISSLREALPASQENQACLIHELISLLGQ